MKSKHICMALLAAGLASAQNQQPTDPRTQAPDQKTQDNKTQQDQDSDQTYEGPTILSREKGLFGQRGGRLIDFRFYGEVTGVYDNGLTPVTTNPQGNLVDVGNSYGATAGFGVIGSRKWRRDRLMLEYKGDYQHYGTGGSFGGFNQFLYLAYSHMVNRRLTINLRDTAGTTTQANGAFSYLPIGGTDLFAIPTNELFDSRTNFVQSGVDAVWQQNSRLSFGIGGDGYLVRRAADSLSGLSGYAARANVAYRLTRRQTIYAAYNYSFFDFQRAFGNSNLHTVTIGYSIGINRKWEYAMSIGATQVSALGLNLVALDPVIAAIVGQNSAVVSFNRTVVAPAGNAQLTRRFDRSALSMGFSMGVSPGNGVYLTSRQNLASVGYSYAGFRRFTLAVNGSYSDLTSVGQTLGKYTNWQGGVGATYKISHSAHAELRYDYRHYTTQDTVYQKDSQRISLGFAFSPGETPLAIW